MTNKKMKLATSAIFCMRVVSLAVLLLVRLLLLSI